MRAFLSIVFLVFAGSAQAQQLPPDRAINLSVTGTEFGKLWDALGEQKAKDVFNLMLKLNNQVVPQIMPPPAAAEPKPPLTD